MLILSRKVGQSIQIGNDLRITVKAVNRGEVDIALSDVLITVKIGETIQLTDGVGLMLTSIARRQAKIGIKADKRIKILRGELTDESK